MKIKFLVIILLVISSKFVYSQTKDTFNYAIPDSVLVKTTIPQDNKAYDLTFDQKLNYQTEIQTQKLLKILFLSGFIFMSLIVVLLIYINNVKIKQILQMIKVQENQLELKNFETEKLSIILNNTVDGVAIVDEQNNILWCNKSFSQLYDLSDEDMKNKPIDFFKSSDSSIQELLDKTKNQTQPVQFAFSLKNKTGVDLFIQRRIIPIVETNSNIRNFAIIDTDFTALKVATMHN